MTTPAQIARMPHWPYRMAADLAAAFCGISETKFREGIADGLYPKGRKVGGNVLWYQDDLIEALDRQRGGAAKSDLLERIRGIGRGRDREAAER